MQIGSCGEAPSSSQLAVLTGTLEHLSAYLHSGCARSLHITRLLLERLDEDSATDSGMQAFCRLLEETVVFARATHHRE